ncbi:MAG: tryptophan--tRNA ligase [Candidatus Taylorbacteria bacterium]
MSKKILLSGVKPTGRPHIGNYFGAMRQFVTFQDEYDCHIFIPDLHALTSVQNKEEMSQAILDVAIDYLAIGLDPEKALLYKQSDIPAHAELAWIFNCITTMPYLMRAHAFKDAETKNKEINVGVFDYPMLMAADILLYDADLVPVGLDQKQHIEIARDTAEKFNRIFGETFKLPEAHMMKEVAVVPGTDGQKMSKSYKNTIPLFATDDELRDLVMGIVTDSSAGMPKNVRAIHELLRDKNSLDTLYEEKKGKYKDLKEALLKDLTSLIAPLRERREKIAKDEKKVLELLKRGGEKARKVAQAKMEIVREKIGVRLY